MSALSRRAALRGSAAASAVALAPAAAIGSPADDRHLQRLCDEYWTLHATAEKLSLAYDAIWAQAVEAGRREPKGGRPVCGQGGVIDTFLRERTDGKYGHESVEAGERQIAFRQIIRLVAPRTLAGAVMKLRVEIASQEDNDEEGLEIVLADLERLVGSTV